MKLLLKNGHVIDYKNQLNDKYDILIEDDKIVKVEKNIHETVDKEIDCTNLNIIPDRYTLSFERAGRRA